ncbi:hypothetical protein KC19_2G257800 [Ceratodon purpureus]|uniref:Protein kinase domain-containing protein n=1 Tax=Ceratodon purpureus TaxID=3225 RepID=A0A8T0IY19_CERPU|nr:hypothetical protein KC19_2G257800 [Ceratodon purpureus]
MGNTNSCVCHMFSVCIGTSSPHLPAGSASNAVGEVGSESVEQRIEQSKSHWSHLREFDSDNSSASAEDVDADNMEVFLSLQAHPSWGNFFPTFGYDTEKWKSIGSLEIGEKFAEGGQAELFHVEVTWRKVEYNEWDQEEECEWVLKVFKKGTRLRHLQSQWPHGMLQFTVEQVANVMSPTPKVFPRFFCVIDCGTLLQDGRFAFLMVKEHLDLRRLIDNKMRLKGANNCGPFSKEKVEKMMFEIAIGMSWLHSHDIVHRDLKASNILVKVHHDGVFQCFVADYKCSIGVVGTGLFRAPEILEACRDKSVSKRPELFTMASDVYSNGMTCYEILTGKLPFDGHLEREHIDVVISGKQPEVPEYVDEWIHKLLSDCWEYDSSKRPSLGEIVNLIYSNSLRIRKLVDKRSYDIEKIEWINWEVK